MLKKTVLSQVHEELNGKMVDFAGWYMPVYYTNVIEEHNTVRNKVGLFDVCHMGEFIVSGENSFDFLQRILTRDISNLKTGKAIYASMCFENGGFVDDLIIYKISQAQYMLVVNAVNVEKDFGWMVKNKIDNVDIKNITDNTTKLDIQGPFAEKTLQKLTQQDLSKIKRFNFVNAEINNINTLVSRTGYTAEKGFELYFDVNKAKDMWDAIMKAGQDFGIKPIGLGARDTLRIEAGYPLYGHEINENITPLETGKNFLVNFTKDFIGKEILLSQKKEGVQKALVCFEMLDKGIPRQDYEIFKNNLKIGFVTSGTFSPTLKKPIGKGYVKTDFTEVGSIIDIKIRNKLYKAKIVKKPFYRYRRNKEVSQWNSQENLSIVKSMNG